MTIPVHPAVATKTALDTLTHYVAPNGSVFGSGPCGSIRIVRLPSKHVSRPSFEDVCAFAEWQKVTAFNTAKSKVFSVHADLLERLTDK